MARGDKEPLPVYECKPPQWLPKSHNSADLGYVGFFPPRPDQEEEVLTETNVKNGVAPAQSVPVETYSAQASVVVTQDALSELEKLMNEIFSRRMGNIPALPPSSFRLPSRVTLNDAKREAWFTDLANPEVPLHKLGKSVPHGAKGHDLLDLLQSNNVAIPRAVWFLRVFGGNETAGLRNRPAYNPTQYSVEWANVVTSYMRKQLLEIALPMAPRPGLNIKHTFKGVLADQDSRDRWLSRFTYCLALLRTFYSEGLVDNRTFLTWLVQQTGSCNLAQLGFMLRLADEYLEGMLISRALTRPFVDACLNRLTEIRANPAKDHLTTSESILKNLILRAFITLPDAFVSPRLWVQYSGLLEELFLEHLDKVAVDTQSKQSVLALNQTLLDTLTDVKTRNHAMLFRDLPPRVLGSLSSALSDIKLLNSLSGKSDMEAVCFFDDVAEDSPAFTRKLDTLLTWSVTPLQYGDHRPYAAASILRFWRGRAEERAIRRDRDSPDDFIQDHLFDWLDSSEAASDAANLSSIALLYGQLVKPGLFSYPKYIQRLIARGEVGLSSSETNGSRHRAFLRWIPLHSSSSALISQRKVTLYGVRIRETPEDINEREIRRQIRSLLPELFDGVPRSNNIPSDLNSHCSALFSAPRFEQVRVMNDWLTPVLKRSIGNQQLGHSNGSSSHIPTAYCVSVILMAHCRCYGSMLDLTLFALEHASSHELLTAVIQTLQQHMEVWACLNMMANITSSLYTAHVTWKSRGVQSRPLLNLLLDVDDGHHLEQAAREQVSADSSAFAHALQPFSDNPCTVPAALPEILLLATDANPEAPSILANSLWYKYRSAPDWAWKVWDNTIASLRQIPSMIGDIAGRRECALRYAAFLRHVDQHTPSGFDRHILEWFIGSGKNEVAALTQEAWDVVTVVLLYLTVHGALATTTVLQGLIYPVWKMACNATSVEQASTVEVFLTAVNEVCKNLLLRDECSDGFPPVDFCEVHGLQTRRRDVYRAPYFSLLVENIPTLVLLEQNVNLSDYLRQGSRALREALCTMSVFRLGIYRDLDTVHSAFEKVLCNNEVAEDLHEPLIHALRLMLNEGQQGCLEPAAGWQMLSTFLSPWKLAATSIELRFTMKQLGEALLRESSRDKASACLDNLTSNVFGQGMNSEEADFIAEMMKGVSTSVAGKFVNAGMRRISDLLNQCPRPLGNGDLHHIFTSVGEVLRLLTNVVDPLRAETSSMPPLEQSTQDKVVQALQSVFSAVFDAVSESKDSPGMNIVSEATILLARIVQFDLGFPGAWTEETKVISERLCLIVADLSLLYGSGSTLDPLTFPLLIDTLHYLLDEYPPDPKATTFDIFHNYPHFELHSLPSDMPFDYRQKIRALLPYVAPNASVANLAYASKDALETNLTPVQNRPWEWTENLGDRLAPEANDDKADEQTAVRNSASLPLELFSARPTGERIISSSSIGFNSRVEGEMRTLQDASSSESALKRDWRETRVSPERAISGPPRRAEQEDEVGAMPTFNNSNNNSNNAKSPSEYRAASRVASPASSVRSRGSVQPPVSLRQSPASLLGLTRLSGSSVGEPIDVDSLDIPASTSTSHNREKRTNTTGGSMGSEDPDIVELSSHAAKKPKVRPAVAKPRTKKR